jgi:poly(A) polymerase
VLPMNPPRVELDHAVRLIFAEHGFAVKRARFPIRLRDAPASGEEGRENSGKAPGGRRRNGPPSVDPGPAAENGQPAPKKRRRRRRKAPSPETRGPGPGDSPLQSSPGANARQ